MGDEIERGLFDTRGSVLDLECHALAVVSLCQIPCQQYAQRPSKFT